MKCPKCGYLGFASGDRCKNCGYDFSLIDPPADAGSRPTPAGRSATDPLVRDPHLARGARYRRPGGLTPAAGVDRPLAMPAEGTPIDLPLFGDMPSALPPPRPPLSVRRSTPTPGRIRPRLDTPRPDILPLAPEDPAAPVIVRADASEQAAAGTANTPTPARQAARTAGPGRRTSAALIDLALLALLDMGVLSFTLRLCGLTTDELHVLPIIPLVAFFLVLNGGYVILFTGTLGQTLGKMAAEIEVVSDRQGGMDMRRSVLRAAALVPSLAPAGIGWLASLVGDHRALHDRMTGTRVIQVSAL